MLARSFIASWPSTSGIPRGSHEQRKGTVDGPSGSERRAARLRGHPLEGSGQAQGFDGLERVQACCPALPRRCSTTELLGLDTSLPTDLPTTQRLHSRE